MQATGGVVTDIDVEGTPYRVHTFTADGDFIVTEGGDCSYLLLAGGGGGGGIYGGGGGAGGLLQGTTAVATGTHAVTVGGGGAGGTNALANPGGNGGASSALGHTAAGGGGGGAGARSDTTGNGLPGGCGGGGGTHTAALPFNVGGAASPSGQGFGGGNGVLTSTDTQRASGGGGGTSQAGNNAAPGAGGSGGNGTVSEITGNSLTYGGGGGGGTRSVDAAGSGGSGGGGAGGYTENGVNGVDGLGGGGGGSGTSSTIAGNGGSGVVIIRYVLTPPAPGPVGEWFPWSHPMMLRYEDDGASNGIIEDVEWNNTDYSEPYGPQFMQRSANTGRFTTLDPLESVEVRWGEDGPIQPLNPVMAVPMVTTVTRPNDAEEFFVRGRIAQSHVTTNWVKSNQRVLHPGVPANPSYSSDVSGLPTTATFIEGTTWTTGGELWVVVSVPARASKIHCQMGTALREGDEGTRHHLVNVTPITLSFPNLVGSREAIVVFRRNYSRPRDPTESRSVKTVIWAENIMGESERVERYHRWTSPIEATSNTVAAPAPTTNSTTDSASSPTGTTPTMVGVGVGVSDPGVFEGTGMVYHPWAPKSGDEEGTRTISLDEGAAQPHVFVDTQNVTITPPPEAINMLLRWKNAGINWYLQFVYPSAPNGSHIYRVPNSETGSSPIAIPHVNMSGIINHQGNAAAEQHYKTVGWWPTHGGGLPNFGAPWGHAREYEYNSNIVLEDSWTAWRVDYYNLAGQLLVGDSQSGSFRRGVVFRDKVVHTASYDYGYHIKSPLAATWPSAPAQL